jgi:hypothetical protein
MVELGGDHPAGPDPADAVGAARVRSASSSIAASTVSIAARCASCRASCRWWSPSAYSTDTDFGGLKVRSNPVTGCLTGRDCSSSVIRAVVRSRSAAGICSGSFATR